jgi:hypothetical protein
MSTKARPEVLPLFSSNRSERQSFNRLIRHYSNVSVRNDRLAMSNLPESDYGGPQRPTGDGMELKRDDWVKTEFDEIGRVVHVSGLNVFVAVPSYPKIDRIEAYLERSLTKIPRQARQ